MKIFKTLIVCCLFFISCKSQPEDNSPVIAQVGETKFTANDLKEVVPENSALQISAEQIQIYIKSWIEKELLYQEAVKRNLTKDPAVQKQIKELTKNCIISHFIDNEIEKNIKVSDDELKQFYNENKQEFIRPYDMYKVRYALFENYRQANAFRKSVMEDADFFQLSRTQSLDTNLKNADDVPWTTAEELPEGARENLKTKVNAYSRPIKTTIGYYIIQILDIRPKGEVQDFDEVAEKIKWRVVLNKKEENYHRYVSLLHENAEIQTDWMLLQQILKDSLQ